MNFSLWSVSAVNSVVKDVQRVKEEHLFICQYRNPHNVFIISRLYPHSLLLYFGQTR